MSDYRDQLQQIRGRYDGRRTVQRDMLDDALRLVDAEVRLRAEQLAGDALISAARHATELATIRDQHDRQVNRLQERADRAEGRVRELEEMRTNLRESQETLDDGVLVKIAAPRGAKWDGSEGNYPRPWTLGELDTVAYRLRLGGATDDTEVRFKHDHTEATIPFPELVIDPPRIIKPAESTRTVERLAGWWTRWSRRPVAYAVWLSVLLTAGVLIGRGSL